MKRIFHLEWLALELPMPKHLSKCAAKRVALIFLEQSLHVVSTSFAGILPHAS